MHWRENFLSEGLACEAALYIRLCNAFRVPQLSSEEHELPLPEEAVESSPLHSKDKNCQSWMIEGHSPFYLSNLKVSFIKLQEASEENGFHKLI